MAMSPPSAVSNITTGNNENDHSSLYMNVGNILNSIAIISITIVTYIALQEPYPLDDWWKVEGFCVNQNPNRIINTEVICCGILVASAILHYIFLQQQQKVQVNKDDNDDYYIMNPPLKARLDAGLFSNAAHGLGHLALMISGPMPIEFTMEPTAIGNVITLIIFWITTLKTLVTSLPNYQSAAMLAFIILSIQKLIDVPPNMSFTYAQSIILLAGSIDQLLLREKWGYTYMIIATSYIPLVILYVIEMTQCSTFLAQMGGHFWYDFYLAALPFGMYYIVKSHETNNKTTTTTKKVE